MQNSSAQAAPCPQSGDIRDFLFGGFAEALANFDEEKFLSNRHPPVFLIYSVFLRYFKQLYQLFDGDLVMALVMAEIWHFNISRYFARSGTQHATVQLHDSEKRRTLLPGCNAYSISQVLGVPSETVRRKVRKLLALGLIERNEDGGLITTRKLEDSIPLEMTVEDTRHFVSAARQVLAMLDKTGT